MKADKERETVNVYDWYIDRIVSPAHVNTLYASDYFNRSVLIVSHNYTSEFIELAYWCKFFGSGFVAVAAAAYSPGKGFSVDNTRHFLFECMCIVLRMGNRTGVHFSLISFPFGFPLASLHCKRKRKKIRSQLDKANVWVCPTF